jgi:uncharacterized membrane protein YkoI
MMDWKLIFAASFAVATLTAAPAGAQLAEQDRAYAARNSGEIRPLRELRSIVDRQITGQRIGEELDERRAREGVYVYRFSFIQTDGRVIRVDVDARSGRIIGEDGR